MRDIWTELALTVFGAILGSGLLLALFVAFTDFLDWLTHD